MITNTKPKEKLVNLRIKNGISQKIAAELMGLGQTTLSMYEIGARMPRVDVAQRIAEFYGVSVDEIDFTGWRK